MTDPSYLETCHLPKPIVELGRRCEIHYIGKEGAGSFETCTANASIRTTDSLKDDAVAPGHLDVLLVPGPDPFMEPAVEDCRFVAAHHAAGTSILSICSGILICKHAGIVAGKHVTGPRALIPSLRARLG